MTERFATGFHPFVIPFLAGMAFVLTVCLIRALTVTWELSPAERKRYFISLITPRTITRNIIDIIADSLLHVKLWKRNALLGYMHSSIAFGWFMLIVLGHIEVLLYCPGRIYAFHYPIFFDWFVEGAGSTVVARLMDFFLVIILSGIVLAIIKRSHSRLFGMKRTARPSMANRLGLYSLWSIFPLRLTAEFCARSGNLTPLPWWAYSIALCIFMLVLPFSRYLHIPAEMMLISMRNAGLKVNRPGKGMARVQADTCPNCGLCIDVCPMNADTSNLRDSTVYLTRQMRRMNNERVEAISDKCLMCGRCTEVCQVGMDGPQLRLMVRSEAKYGIGPDFSSPSVADGLHVNSVGKVLYFGGCMTQLTPHIGRSIESLLRKAGVDYEWMDRDGGLCCGRPLRTAGRVTEASDLVKRNEELIVGSGSSTLLASCPICYREFTQIYDLPGVKVVHYAVFFNEMLYLGRLKATKADTSYVYHDPCELGRGCGIYESPRKLLSAASTLHEAGRSREDSICCGGSLGSLSLDFAHREKITAASLENLYTSGADAIATACPLCLTTFGRYSDRPVKDLATILDEQTK